MIDIHCHILPGIDDGASDIEESLAMAQLAYEDGIRHIVATPHFNAHFHNVREIVIDKVKQLQDELDQASIPVTIYPGNEVRLENAAYIYDHAEHERFCYLGHGMKFILLEQRWHQYSDESEEIVGWFMNRGTIPIVPHPERHIFFREDPSLLERLLKLGAWTQVSVDSLLGKNGEDAYRFARRLMEHNLIHTLATDAHNINRKPNLSAGFHIVENAMGKDRAGQIRERMESILA